MLLQDVDKWFSMLVSAIVLYEWTISEFKLNALSYCFPSTNSFSFFWRDLSENLLSNSNIVCHWYTATCYNSCPHILWFIHSNLITPFPSLEMEMDVFLLKRCYNYRMIILTTITYRIPKMKSEKDIRNDSKRRNQKAENCSCNHSEFLFNLMNNSCSFSTHLYGKLHSIEGISENNWDRKSFRY